MTSTLHWTGTLTALSSIAHGGETRGTITLLRRETILQPDGRPTQVPVISGNSLRGRLRRIGEELLRDTLDYEGQLALPAAQALRSGGSLAKTSREPLSGRRLHELRSLVPQIGIFGCAGGGRIIDGCLQVGKVIPHVAETRHIVPTDAAPDPDALPAFDATQIESYARRDDSDHHAVATPASITRVPVDDAGQPQFDDLDAAAAADHPGTLEMLYRVETFPAGTRFTTWLRLDRATDLEVSFFTDILDHFTTHGRLGGRAAIGHGQTRADLQRTTLAGNPTPADWRRHLHDNRDAALAALEAIA